MTTPLKVNGVDISHWQSGKLDFKKAKAAGVQFVYHKATESNNYKDPNYDKRRKEAKAAGVPFGAYHFARPNVGEADAVAEADYFLAFAKPVSGDLIPALDLEVSGGLNKTQLQAWAVAFSNRVHSKLGVYPVIYGPYEFTKKALPGLRWVPRYNNSNTPPTQAVVDIWQFSNGQYGVPKTVAGFGNVDLNTFRGTTKLSDLVIGSTTSPTIDKMNPKNYYVGAKGAHVKWLKGRLKVHGFSSGMVLTSPVYGKGAKKNVMAFQKKQGWKGADADGLPGPETLKRLAADPKPTTPVTPTPSKETVVWDGYVTTANVCELPRHDKTIAADLAAILKKSDIALWQEMANDFYEGKLLAITGFEHSVSKSKLHNDTPISVRDGKGDITARAEDIFQKSKAGVSHERLITRANITLPGGHKIQARSCHFWPRAWNPDGSAKPRANKAEAAEQPWRQAEWLNGQKILLEKLERDAGIPSLLGTDQNRAKVSALPANIKGFKVQTVAHGIDWLYLIDGTGYKWKLVGKPTIFNPDVNNDGKGDSDHAAIIQRVQLIKLS